MKTSDLYKNKADCCGCELCANSCPKSIIVMKPDDEGFLYPCIQNEIECIECGTCVKVCPVNSPGRKLNPILSAVGGYIEGKEDLKKSSSGGFATAISRSFITHYQGIVYGVSYVNGFAEVRFLRATSTEELELFRTSKYSQAKKGNIYDDIKQDIINGKNVLFIGLPCEVSAVYHKIGTKCDNLYTISLICHGPTSPKVNYDYVKALKEKFNSNIEHFSVRYKYKGWKPYYIHAVFESGEQYNEEFGISDYGIAFQYLKRPSCSSCKYKYGNLAFGLISDLTIGDFHAVTPDMPHYNSMGVSEACIHTDKGRKLIALLGESNCVEPIPLEKIMTGNRALYEAIPQRPNRDLFVNSFLTGGLKEVSSLKDIRRPIYRSYYKKRIREVLKKMLKFFLYNK